jgi:para-nitrobenzyl esterase
VTRSTNMARVLFCALCASRSIGIRGGISSWRLRRILFALAGTLAWCFWSTGHAAITEPVRIDSGLVSGVPGREASITVFKGIPYAAPPVGNLRWRAPQPVMPWQGIRRADQFSAPCVQAQRDTFIGSEDCLYVNVWIGAASGRERRPVIVWTYPDGFRGNSSANPMFDGEGLARKGVVVVNFNYRAGVFGFLAHPELSAESGHGSGNYAILDQIAVLQWVKRNIAAFGGDPNRVTIAGQSAGGLSALILSRSPLTKGLFHRAIMQSRATGIRTDVQQAERDGVAYAEARGAHSLQELRALPWQKLKEGDRYDQPIVDNYVIKPDFYQFFVDGLEHDVPVMLGNARDEDGAQPQPNAKAAQLQAFVSQRYGEMAGEFFKLYPFSTDTEAGIVKNLAAREDSRMRAFLPATQGRDIGRNKSFVYHWTHAPPGPNSARQGAFHESEITYVFDSLEVNDRPWTEEDRHIADLMSSYWANFAARGDPNGKGLPRWPAADAKSPVVMELGDHFGPMSIGDPVRLDFIRRFYESHPASAGRWQ